MKKEESAFLLCSINEIFQSSLPCGEWKTKLSIPASSLVSRGNKNMSNKLELIMGNKMTSAIWNRSDKKWSKIKCFKISYVSVPELSSFNNLRTCCQSQNLFIFLKIECGTSFFKCRFDNTMCDRHMTLNKGIIVRTNLSYSEITFSLANSTESFR